MGKLCDGWKVSGKISAGYAYGGDCPGYRSSCHRGDRAEQVGLIRSVVGWVCQQSDLVCGCFFSDFNRAEPDYSKQMGKKDLGARLCVIARYECGCSGGIVRDNRVIGIGGGQDDCEEKTYPD